MVNYLCFAHLLPIYVFICSRWHRAKKKWGTLLGTTYKCCDLQLYHHITVIKRQLRNYYACVYVLVTHWYLIVFSLIATQGHISRQRLTLCHSWHHWRRNITSGTQGWTHGRQQRRAVSRYLLRPNVSVSVSHFGTLSLSFHPTVECDLFSSHFFPIHRNTRVSIFFGIQAWSFLSSLFVVRPSVGMRICFGSSKCSVPSSAFL
jgi:hypothetical protein